MLIKICKLVGPDLVQGVADSGDGVHDALRNLADNLVREGVWIDVPAASWRVARPSGSNGTRSVQQNGAPRHYVVDSRLGSKVMAHHEQAREDPCTKTEKHKPLKP